MMKKILLAVVLCGGFGLTSVSAQQAEGRLLTGREVYQE